MTATTKVRNWQARVDPMPDVQKLVHLLMRMTEDDVQKMTGELTTKRRMAYEDELTNQALRVGCPGQRGRLTSGPSLTALREESRKDATGIVATYNYDLSLAIAHIRQETPTANRHVYIKRLEEWDKKRAAWKAAQIAQYTEATARRLAQQDFYTYNYIQGYANLQPTAAKCPVCVGWVARGDVPLHEAQGNPPPYHVNCPHRWQTFPDKVPARECRLLWMGQ